MVGIISTLIVIPILGGGITALFGKTRSSAARLFSLAVSVVAMALAFFLYSDILIRNTGGKLNFVEGPHTWISTFKGIDYLVGMDGLSAPLVLISTILTFLVILGSWDLIKEKEAPYYGMVLFFEGVIIGVFTSLNLALFFVFWELVLVPMFFFIGIWGGPNRKYAAMKFLIFTHVGSAFMFIAFLALWLFGGNQTMNITELVKIPLWLQTIGSIATFIGFGVKLPVVPFHTWLPDAHVEAPAPISVFLAGLLLKMGGYGFLRINIGLFPDAAKNLAWFFIFFGLLTMFYGGIVAMIQSDMKRMIALTSINHMGFVLLGAYTGNPLGISGAIFQMFNHAALIGLLFMLSGYVHKQAGTRDLTELKGLKTSMPRTSVLLVLGSMAAMGVPTFSSFISEFMVILGAISVNPWLAVSVGVPLITVGYFLWMLRRAVFSPLPAGLRQYDMKLSSAAHLSLYIVPLLILVIAPWLVLGVTDSASATLIAILRRS